MRFGPLQLDAPDGDVTSLREDMVVPLTEGSRRQAPQQRTRSRPCRSRTWFPNRTAHHPFAIATGTEYPIQATSGWDDTRAERCASAIPAVVRHGSVFDSRLFARSAAASVTATAVPRQSV